MNAMTTMEVAIRFVKTVMEAITANATLGTSFHRTIIPALVRFLHSSASNFAALLLHLSKKQESRFLM